MSFAAPSDIHLDTVGSEDVSCKGSCYSSCSINILVDLSAIVRLQGEKCTQHGNFSPRVLSLLCIYIYWLSSSFRFFSLGPVPTAAPLLLMGSICRRQRDALKSFLRGCFAEIHPCSRNNNSHWWQALDLAFYVSEFNFFCIQKKIKCIFLSGAGKKRLAAHLFSWA